MSSVAAVYIQERFPVEATGTQSPRLDCVSRRPATAFGVCKPHFAQDQRRDTTLRMTDENLRLEEPEAFAAALRLRLGVIG